MSEETIDEETIDEETIDDVVENLAGESDQVLDGEYKFEDDEVIVEEEFTGSRVVEVGKANESFDKRSDIPFDTFYYGNVLSSGLVEVRKRTARDVSIDKWIDVVVWLEGNIIMNGEGRKIAYHILHEPSASELFPEYFYPTTQWNISRSLLSEQDNVPGWKRMTAMKTIQNQSPQPFRVISPGRGTTVVSSFHFVIVNRRYLPTQEGGRKIDGMFVLSPPASGKYIQSYRNAIKIMGGTPIGLARQRASDNAIAI